MKKPQIADVLQEANVVFEDSHVIWCALDDYVNTKSADFADALIVNSRHGAKG